MDVSHSIIPAPDSIQVPDTTSTSDNNPSILSDTPVLSEPKTSEHIASSTIETLPAPISTPNSNVLSRAINRYKWQLGQVPKDIDRLESLKEKHMKDPFEFLRQLKSKEFRYPENQKILPAPSIEWTKYQFPPANPVSPTKIHNATYLNPISFTDNHDRTSSNIVSLNSRRNDNTRSRAGSPSYERLRTVKETAKSLGINTVQLHYPNQHHHINNHDPEPNTNGSKPSDIEETQTVEPEDLPNHEPQDTNQASSSRSLSPGISGNQNSMEGIVYSGEGEQTIERQTEITPAAQLGSSSYIPTQQQSTTSFEPVNITIDHSLGHDLGTNSNITYNHMSGSFEVQPGNPIKPRGTSREGSGVRDEPKPPLYNIPWSDEEQQLLERLLEVYPDEPVAAQRFQKISAAMGTRTPKQVASRVQKYFIKLVKAGLEAPGRMNYSLETSKPKNKIPATKGKKRKDAPGGQSSAGTDLAASGKGKAARPQKKKDLGVGAIGGNGGSGSKKKQKSKSLLGSGFGRTSGTQYLNYISAPTVYMSDEDDEESVQDMLSASSVSLGKNISVLNSGFQRGGPDGIATHLGYSCDSCGVEPILGIRYSCIDCIELGGTDLCGPCFNSGEYHNELHLLSHQFQAIESAEVPSYSNSHRSSSVGPSGTSGIFQI
ncbi:ZZ-type zinc finger-containing protein 3 [Entomortierella beljakovae]|nr:ZZ-type zinc finger-containing protein 3 [Entomortierella beljakovae]